MRRLQFLGVLFLSSFGVAAQTCPAVNFRTASQVSLGGPGQLMSGMQRLSDGSFTLHTYSYTTTSATQIGTTPQFQKSIVSCDGRSAQPVVPPANWSFLGNPLLGTMPRDPALAELSGAGTSVALCLSVCNLNQSLMQMIVGTPALSYSSAPTYPVDSNATGILTADLNHDGMGDAIVVDYLSLYVFLMQAGGTLAARPSLTTAGGNISSAIAADLDGDGNIDLAATDSSANTITIFLGNGDGTFRSQTPVNTGTFPLSVVAADVNGDHKLDLMVAAEGGVYVHFGNGDGTFQAKQMYPTSGFVSALAAADLNGDGKPDLAAVDEDDGVMEVLLNAGNGTFTNATGYVVGFPSDISQLFLMDFDWDGKNDIVFGAGHPDALSPAAYTHLVTVLFGNGDGTFNGIPAYPIAGSNFSEVGGLAIADFNGDGKPDALAGTSSGISLLIGHGDGTFTPQALPLQQGSSSLAAGDFDRNGKMDFVAASSNGIGVYLGNGAGAFQQSASISTASEGITGAAVGDFNGDSNPDFAVVDSQGGASATVLVYLGNGDGTFQNPKTFSVGSTPQGLQAADVDGDGKLDLVVTNNGTLGSSTDLGNVMVLLGNGNGTFQPAVPYTAGANPVFSLVADINGDGKPDLITSTELDAESFAYGLIVRLNQGGGVFGAAQAIATDFGPTEIGAGDFDGDGKVDLLVAHCCGDTQMGYLLGNGNGTFQPEVLVLSGTGQVNLRVADLNGDGKPDAMFTLNGPYAASLVNLGAIAGSTTTAITIQTNPTGLQFSVDGGTAQTAPQTLNLTQGTHTIAVTATQAGAPGTQYAFSGWSDGLAASHSITAGASAATYTATFTTQYLLTTAVSPAGAGSVTASPSSSGYYNAGTSVQLTASANAGYQFSSWTGGLSGSTNPQSIAMNTANSVTANFNASGSTCSFGFTPASASLPATGTSTAETCPNNSGQPNCGVAPEVPVTFTVTPGATCGAWTATSSNPGVLQITSGASGSGSGTVGFTLLNNTHNGQQNYTVTVASAAGSTAYSVTEAGSEDSQIYREVYALYEQLLGRDPDPAGFAFWAGSGGAGLGQMADSFLTSPEAFNSDFAVMAAYQAAIGTPPTYAQFTAAVTSVRAGTQTVPGLFNALIGSGYSATSLYQNLLSRAPAAGDTTCINSGVGACFQTIIGYPSSTTPVGAANNEFQSTGSYRTTDHTNGLYVQMIYYVTVSRDPDAAGLAFWIGIANSGGPGVLFQGSAGYETRIQILGPGTPNQGFIGSPEFQGLFAN
jgi:hypothetical protein